MIDKKVIVIGAGLAGSEAAWQIANSGTPKLATCQAASEPARPAPITITSLSNKLD